MKKLSLLLAVLMLACCALAACGGDDTNSSSSAATSSAAESSAAVSSAASSAAATSSEETTTSEEIPPEEIEDNSDAVENPDHVNLALNKSYTLCDLYRQGDASNQWGYKPENPITYPDEDGDSLTDGLFPTEDDFHDVAWIGMHGKTPDCVDAGYVWATVDLEKKYWINDVKVYVGGKKLGGGIGAPVSVEIFVSNDGENFKSAGYAVLPVDDESTSVLTAELELDAPVAGRYVQFRAVSGSWCFVSELEVY